MLRRHSARAVFLGALLAAIGASYAPSLSGPFTFDDHRSVAGRSDFRDLPGVAAALPASVLGHSRAVSDFTFALNRSLDWADPLPLRVTNVLIHLALTLVLAALGLAVLRRAGLDSEWVALIAAAIWGLHPLATEAVAYISQRPESLSSLFYAGAILLALRSESWRRPWLGYALASGCVLLGLGAKGLTVTAFAVLALAAAHLPDDRSRPRWRPIAVRVAPGPPPASRSPQEWPSEVDTEARGSRWLTSRLNSTG